MDKPVILIIDDDANLRKTLSDILRIKGYEPLAAADGAGGLALLKDKSVNLALIDLGLPDMSGLDVLERIKADHPLTEAIILTGNATLDSAVEATNKGAFSYLTKPYEIDQLMLHIRRVLEKQRTELALRESEERYRIIMDSVNLGISLIDINHKVIMTNRFFAELFKKPAADFVGKYCFKEFEKREAICSHCPGVLAMASGKPAEVETEGVLDDGSRFNVLLRTVPTFASDGTVNGFIEVIEDITERKRAETALAESRDHIRLINKIIRHDLLNDFGVIKSALRLYERSKEERFLDEAAARVEKSLELIARMRELEAFVYSHGGLKPVSAGEVLRKVAENYKGIEFSIPCKGQVMADEALDSVIENIVSNAAKHSKTERMDISMTCTGEFCEIRIADHGIGIPDEIKSKIFEEGFVFGSTGQTGMGLYIVKKAMDHYGGSVHVEDNPDGGAVFVLRFRRVG